MNSTHLTWDLQFWTLCWRSEYVSVFNHLEQVVCGEFWEWWRGERCWSLRYHVVNWRSRHVGGLIWEIWPVFEWVGWGYGATSNLKIVNAVSGILLEELRMHWSAHIVSLTSYPRWKSDNNFGEGVASCIMRRSDVSAFGCRCHLQKSSSPKGWGSISRRCKQHALVALFEIFRWLEKLSQLCRVLIPAQTIFHVACDLPSLCFSSQRPGADHAGIWSESAVR